MKILLTKIFFVIYSVLHLQSCNTQTIYINSKSGNDNNDGSFGNPLKTLTAGISLVNDYTGDKPLFLKIEPGLYYLDTNLTIEYNKYYAR